MCREITWVTQNLKLYIQGYINPLTKYIFSYKFNFNSRDTLIIQTMFIY